MVATGSTDLAAELETLKQRLRAIEDHQSSAENAKAKESAAKSNQQWNVKLGGHVQTDYIQWASTDPAITDPLAVNYFSFRLRLAAAGTGYENFDFRLQMTLEPGEGLNANTSATPDVKDAYISINNLPLLGRIRMGNFFVPFSLEQVTNDTNNVYLERSIPTQGIFAADREVGIAAYNCTPDQNVTWTTGLFFDNLSDTFKTRFGDRQGYRTSGRVTWLPYFDTATDGRYLVHTGAGVLYTNDHDRLARFAARPHVQRGPILLDSTPVPANNYTTGNLELAIVWGRWTSQSEAFLCSVNRTADRSASIGGAYTHLSFFLTGESRRFERFGQHGAQFGRNRPIQNFFATKQGEGWGAWELKTRWSYLDLIDLGAGQYNDLPSASTGTGRTMPGSCSIDQTLHRQRQPLRLDTVGPDRTAAGFRLVIPRRP